MDVIAIVKSWAKQDISDNFLALDGFNTIRWDRQETSGKQKGGGLLLYVNKDWGVNISIKEQICTPEVEILAVCVRPFWLPREFSAVYIILHNTRRQ